MADFERSRSRRRSGGVGERAAAAPSDRAPLIRGHPGGGQSDCVMFLMNGGAHLEALDVGADPKAAAASVGGRGGSSDRKARSEIGRASCRERVCQYV